MRQNISFDNSYARLPKRFFSHVSPTTVSTPKLLKLNVPLAKELGLDENWLSSDEGVDMLAGNFVPDQAEPIAAIYAGHQFGHFTPQLGDGRAILLGEIIGKNGRRDIQLKGSGPTPYSRRGDGRAALGPVLREYIISEAMFALGIPTTRALACVTTGEKVIRDKILPGAVLTRVAASHIRIGTFQYFAAQNDVEAVKILADYAIARHYPDAALASNPYVAFLDAVIISQAKTVAQWQNIGFIHGVMNTDNMSISGETVDYGPCAFMDIYDPKTVFSSIDAQGRYAYANQPKITQWNLARFAETLMPLMANEETDALNMAQTSINNFAPAFETAYFKGLRAKLGLFMEQEGDKQLIGDLLVLLAKKKQDYTLFFQTLSSSHTLFDDVDLQIWMQSLTERMNKEPQSKNEHLELIKRSNPVYIPRNHLVEKTIDLAIMENNYEQFEKLLNVLSNPYEERTGYEEFARPLHSTRQYQTFCGT